MPGRSWTQSCLPVRPEMLIFLPLRCQFTAIFGHHTICKTGQRCAMKSSKTCCVTANASGCPVRHQGAEKGAGCPVSHAVVQQVVTGTLENAVFGLSYADTVAPDRTLYIQARFHANPPSGVVYNELFIMR